MKPYIGAKVVKAEPMSEITFLNKIKRQPVETNRKDREGYLVVYPDDYKSWSPKAVFEQAYREVDPKEAEIIGYFYLPEAE